MAVVISEILTEVVLTPPAAAPGAEVAAPEEDVLDVVVRRATERVLEVLRREWDS